MSSERERGIVCLQQLRKLLTDDEKLKSPIHDEKFLLRFVIGNNYDATLAYKCIKQYFTMRKKFPNAAKNVIPSYEPAKHMLESNTICILKNKDRDGRRVLLMNTIHWDVAKYTLEHFMCAYLLCLEELLFLEEVQLNGITICMDKEDFSMSHAMEYTPDRLRILASFVQGSLPLKVKGVLVIKEPQVLDLVLVPARALMTEKLKSRFHLIGYDMAKLHTIIPPESLPARFGGTLTEENYFDEKFRQNLFKRDSYYKELLEYGVGEGCSDDEDTYE